jgi:anti-sigma B factor antagonist
MLGMRVAHDHGCAVVRLCGELDVAQAVEARGFFLAVAKQGCDRVVVDATDLVFIDAAGLGVLVAAARMAAESGGWLRLADASPMLRRMLRVVELTAVLPVYESVQAAATADVPAR